MDFSCVQQSLLINREGREATQRKMTAEKKVLFHRRTLRVFRSIRHIDPL